MPAFSEFIARIIGVAQCCEAIFHRRRTTKLRRVIHIKLAAGDGIAHNLCPTARADLCRPWGLLVRRQADHLSQVEDILMRLHLDHFGNRVVLGVPSSAQRQTPRCLGLASFATCVGIRLKP